MDIIWGEHIHTYTVYMLIPFIYYPSRSFNSFFLYLKYINKHFFHTWISHLTHCARCASMKAKKRKWNFFYNYRFCLLFLRDQLCVYGLVLLLYFWYISSKNYLFFMLPWPILLFCHINDTVFNFLQVIIYDARTHFAPSKKL